MIFYCIKIRHLHSLFLLLISALTLGIEAQHNHNRGIYNYRDSQWWYIEDTQGLEGITPSFFNDAQQNCQNFIRSDGGYGDWGREMALQMEQYPIYQRVNRGIIDICPRFGEFDKRQKYHFWVWFMAAVASQESRCVTTELGPINRQDPSLGRPTGLFQMEPRQSTRWWRGNYCAQPGEMTDPILNVQCAVQIMAHYLNNDQGPLGRVSVDVDTEFYNSLSTRKGNSYWQPLRNIGAGDYQNVMDRVGQYRDCFE